MYASHRTSVRTFDFDRAVSYGDALVTIAAALDDEDLVLLPSDNGSASMITTVIVDGYKRFVVPSSRIGRKPTAVRPDRHAGQVDPIHGERPHRVCADCGQIFTDYYYRMHRGPSYDERCPSIIETETEMRAMWGDR